MGLAARGARRLVPGGAHGPRGPVVAGEHIQVARPLRLGLGVEELARLLEAQLARDAVVLVAQVDVLEADEHDAAVDEGEADVALQGGGTVTPRPAYSRAMLAAYAARQDPDDPLAGLEVGERPAPEVPEGWTTVTVKAASLNHHDLWSLRGVGLSEGALPMVLGCDAAGIDAEGNEVVVHAVVASPGWTGEETLDPKRSLLSERYQGTLAEQVVVPKQNLIPKPAGLSFEHAACLPTAWLTAYRMLFTRAEARPGSTVLVQGAGGGVATALIALGAAAGVRVWVTSRTEEKRAQALALGADQAFESGARLPERVDAVMETVGEATWGHSVRALKPGGVIVVSGATSGDAPSAELTRTFFLQLRVLGSTMGSSEELRRLVQLVASGKVTPTVDRVLPLAQARDGFAAMASGELYGKVVFTN